MSTDITEAPGHERASPMAPGTSATRVQDPGAFSTALAAVATDALRLAQALGCQPEEAADVVQEEAAGRGVIGTPVGPTSSRGSWRLFDARYFHAHGDGSPCPFSGGCTSTGQPMTRTQAPFKKNSRASGPGTERLCGFGTASTYQSERSRSF
jgi:hypothetical protein